jgi:hypothetical protein
VFSNKLVRRCRIVILASALPAAAAAQGRTLDSVEVSGVVQAARSVVSVTAANVSIVVTGRSGRAVSAALLDAGGPAPRVSYEGMVRATLENDTVRIELARPVDALRLLRVSVPTGVSLRLAGDNGGRVQVQGVGGPVEISHSNGGVSVLDATGYALVATSNGDVVVRLSSVAPDVPMSFITNNGNIDLTLPADIRATLLIDTSITLQSEYSMSRAESDGRRGSPRLIRFLINGGGPTIRVFTNNGVVRLHRLTASPH